MNDEAGGTARPDATGTDGTAIARRKLLAMTAYVAPAVLGTMLYSSEAVAGTSTGGPPQGCMPDSCGPNAGGCQPSSCSPSSGGCQPSSCRPRS